MKKTSAYVATAALAVLPACGGGSSGPSTPAPTPTPTATAQLELVSAPGSPIQLNAAGLAISSAVFVFDCTLPDSRGAGGVIMEAFTADGRSCVTGSSTPAIAITAGQRQRFTVNTIVLSIPCRPSATTTSISVSCQGDGRNGISRTFALTHLWTP